MQNWEKLQFLGFLGCGKPEAFCCIVLFLCGDELRNEYGNHLTCVYARREVEKISNSKMIITRPVPSLFLKL